MAQVYKIVRGKENVECNTWFEKYDEDTQRTKGSAHPLNLRRGQARLEVRRHFFSQRVVENWNNTPANMKEARTVKQFKRLYGAYRKQVATAY